MNQSQQGSSIQEILQAKTLEWIANPFFRESSQSKDQTYISYAFYIGRQVPYH